ncbi:MAG: hypothetical protein MK165_14120 [Pirellulaceae bacterium]|nr:hypothetical protein [Pirellulaceae bacterium]
MTEKQELLCRRCGKEISIVVFLDGRPSMSHCQPCGTYRAIEATKLPPGIPAYGAGFTNPFSFPQPCADGDELMFGPSHIVGNLNDHKKEEEEKVSADALGELAAADHFARNDGKGLTISLRGGPFDGLQVGITEEFYFDFEFHLVPRDHRFDPEKGPVPWYKNDRNGRTYSFTGYRRIDEDYQITDTIEHETSVNDEDEYNLDEEHDDDDDDEDPWNLFKEK